MIHCGAGVPPATYAGCRPEARTTMLAVSDPLHRPRRTMEEGDKGRPGLAGAGPDRRAIANSIVSEIVVSMTILMLAAVVLISIFVSWTYNFMMPEYAAQYAP